MQSAYFGSNLIYGFGNKNGRFYVRNPYYSSSTYEWYLMDQTDAYTYNIFIKSQSNSYNPIMQISVYNSNNQLIEARSNITTEIISHYLGFTYSMPNMDVELRSPGTIGYAHNIKFTSDLVKNTCINVITYFGSTSTTPSPPATNNTIYVGSFSMNVNLSIQSFNFYESNGTFIAGGGGGTTTNTFARILKIEDCTIGMAFFAGFNPTYYPVYLYAYTGVTLDENDIEHLNYPSSTKLLGVLTAETNTQLNQSIYIDNLSNQSTYIWITNNTMF